MEKKKLDLEEIVALIRNSLPKLSAEEQKVFVQIYRLLAVGQPVPHDKKPQTLHVSNDVVNDILSRWWGIYYDEKDRIIGFWGLTLKPMSHRFEVNGHTLYTWCAWDSLFIPEIIQKTARVESTCPVTGAKIRLTVTPKDVKQLDPAGAVMSFITPEAAKIRENVIANFCHYVYFFSSAEAGTTWISKTPGTFLLSIDEAYYLGRKKNEFQFKEALVM
ncbi:MAG TPA: alkylmercury lyase MerB [Candidatus Limnocylindrales bacterium]|nr:alkylmercury lyase MerB [Candidatus Limnocylindrales bacterium]